MYIYIYTYIQVCTFPHYVLSCVCACMLSCVQLFAIPWTVTCQALLSMEFSRQEYLSRLLFPIPGDLPNLGFEPKSLVSPAWRWVLYHCIT